MKKYLPYCLLLVFFSCRKESGGEGDCQLPVIMLTAPANNQSFSSCQNITITGIITDNVKIGELHLEIINTVTGAFITHEHFLPGCASFNLSKTFVAQANSAYKIKVEAQDGNGNKAKAEVNIISN